MLLLSLTTAALTALAAWAAWAACAATRRVLQRGAVLDRPNERSSHDRPVPRGGGLGVVAVVLPAWLLLWLLGGFGPAVPVAVAAALALAALSFADDLRGLGAGVRLLGHGSAVVAFVALALPAEASLFGGALPFWLDRGIVAVGWIWFVNLYNFMDGIDGITGVETMAIAGGLAAVALLEGDGTAPLAAVLAGAAAGFLVLNWHPARLFLGDVGSVPLGYLVGALLVWQACVEGRWWLALLLPLYYWGDATTTLVMRALRGERIWRAHRAHAYQSAVRRGVPHDRVVLFVAALDALLLLLVLVVVAGVLKPWVAVAAGTASVTLGLWYLRGARLPGWRS